MSVLKVDSLVEKTSGNGVHIPGHVIQVVQSTGTNGTIYNTHGAYVTTPYTSTITPKFSTSKILATFSFSVLLRTNSSSSAAAGFSILRDTTRIVPTLSNAHEMFISGTSVLSGNRQNLIYLDSPNTTSATIYKLEAWLRYSGQTTEFDSRNSTWSVTLQEIAQ